LDSRHLEIPVHNLPDKSRPVSSVQNIEKKIIKTDIYIFNLFCRELDYRKINDKMIQFERAFIDPEGLPGRRIYK
jgi:hypothetical protein